jgi:hypothetical protein
MDFGLFVACHRFDESVSTREVYDQALEMVELADEAGFRIAWFPEHHLIHYISSPSPLMLAKRRNVAWQPFNITGSKAIVYYLQVPGAR